MFGSERTLPNPPSSSPSSLLLSHCINPRPEFATNMSVVEVDASEDVNIPQEVAVGSIAHVIHTTFESTLANISSLPEAFHRLDRPPPSKNKLTTQEVYRRP